MTQKYPRETRWLAVLVVISIAIHLYFSWLSLHNLLESSDEASAALLAQDIAHGARPLLFTGQPYQFPIEGYLIAPISGMLPHNALGARGPGLVLSFIAFIILLVTAWKTFSPGNRWPAIALIAFPSAYWLIHTSGYTPPQYASSTLLAAALFYLTISIARRTQSHMGLLVLTGILSGLALSNHLLLISVVAGVFAVVVFRGDFRKSVRNALFFSVGLVIGLIPYILALALVPDAYQNVSDTRPLADILKLIFSPVESFALAGAFGFNPPVFIDTAAHLFDNARVASLLEMLYLAFLAFVLLNRFSLFFRQIRQGAFPVLGWPDLFLITSLATLVLFASSAHAAAIDHRYLLPAVWSFPFLAGYVYASSATSDTKIWRKLIAGGVTAIVLFNIGAITQVTRLWHDKDALPFSADIRDLSPVINWLKKNNYSRCYASFWTAYRITWETDRTILCSLLYNERYFHWPVPFKQTVDDSPRVAAVITNTYTSHIHTTDFETMLKPLDIQFKRTPVEKFAIYHDFSIPDERKQHRIPTDEYKLSANTKNNNLAPLLDNDPITVWDSQQDQASGQTLEADFTREIQLNGVSLFYNHTDYGPAFQITTEVKSGGEWRAISTDNYGVDALRFLNGHPVIGRFQQIIRFSPVTADAVRIKITIPAQGLHWKISDLAFYEVAH